MALVMGVASYGGSDVGEADRAGRRLAQSLGDDEAWFRTWLEEGEAVRRLAQEAEATGKRLTAASAYLRSVTYLQIGERFRTPKDGAALNCYRDALDSFGRYSSLVDWPLIEKVQVPFEGGSLPAYLAHASASSRPPPVVVYFDGLDITKEMCFLRGATELLRRGLSVLLVDGPGNGESIRFRDLPLRYDYERAGSAAIDYLEGRSDVDAGRVGVLAISLGGYYASRCAALEPRFKACVAWGAIWDYHETWRRRIESNFSGSISVPSQHLEWVLGVSSRDEAMHKLEDFKLSGVVEAMSCPFLVLHGEHDEQVPLEVARQLWESSGSKDKTLHVFSAKEGGGQHCQSDQLTAATTKFSDWLAEKLGA